MPIQVKQYLVLRHQLGKRYTQITEPRW